MVTAEELRAVLSYEAETGQFIRLQATLRSPAGSIAGTPHGEGYSVIRVNGRLYLAHRLAWLWMTGEWPTEIDHRDRNRSNNRWANLREVTRTQNNYNAGRRSDNTSGFRGVYRNRGRGKPWRARVQA